MIAFAACIVSFPALMSQWPALGLKLSSPSSSQIIAGLAPRIDVMSGATPLDALKTALKLGEGSVDVPTLLATRTSSAISPAAAGSGSAVGYLLGGLWLWQRKLISWHAPVGFIRRLELAGWLRSGRGTRSSSPIRCSISSPVARCSAPSSSSPTRSPVARRRKAS
jgi:electron transport complex protein RnfD